MSKNQVKNLTAHIRQLKSTNQLTNKTLKEGLKNLKESRETVKQLKQTIKELSKIGTRFTPKYVYLNDPESGKALKFEKKDYLNWVEGEAQIVLNLDETPLATRVQTIKDITKDIAKARKETNDFKAELLKVKNEIKELRETAKENTRIKKKVITLEAELKEQGKILKKRSKVVVNLDNLIQETTSTIWKEVVTEEATKRVKELIRLEKANPFLKIRKELEKRAKQAITRHVEKPEVVDFIKTSEGLDGVFLGFSSTNSPAFSKDFILYAGKVRTQLKNLFLNVLRTYGHNSFKTVLKIRAVFFNQINDVHASFNFVSAPMTIQRGLSPDEIDEIILDLLANIRVNIEEFQGKGSGFSYESTEVIEVLFSRFKPLRGGSFIELPAAISLKKACRNIKNKDNRCFDYALCSGLFPASSHVDRPSSYKLEMIKVPDGQSYPVKMTDVVKYERLNNCRINVFGLDKETVIVYRTSRFGDKETKVVDMLLITEETNTEADPEKVGESFNWHFIHINDLSRLLSSQISNHKEKKFFCRLCLCPFGSEDVLEKHYETCENLTKGIGAKVVMPEEGKNVLAFKNSHWKVMQPFFIAADFEAFIGNDKEHRISSFSYKVVCSADESKSKPLVIKMGNARDFLNNVSKECAEIMALYVSTRKSLPCLSENEKREYFKADSCYLCENRFNCFKIEEVKKIKETSGSAFLKVRDHCHVSGVYRGAACSSCNLKARTPTDVPIFFHNGGRYDNHFIVSALCSSDLDGGPSSVKCVANTEQNYSTFTIGKMRFLDSFNFLSASLDKLTSSMKMEDLKFIRELVPDGNEEKIKLLLRKIPYPYEYLNSTSRMLEPVPIARAKFYDSLNERKISVNDYMAYKNICQVFGLKTSQDYHDLYLSLDTLLLADVIESFRIKSIKLHGIDPAYCISLPQFSFNAMLKKTGVNLEQITDVDTYQAFESGIRGGVSCAFKRYAEANNKYLPDFNPDKPSTFINDQDMNNLYGAAMLSYLPTDGFTWEDVGSICIETVLRTEDQADRGFYVNVNLEVPTELHDYFNDFPLCPERREVDDSELSEYQTDLKSKLYDSRKTAGKVFAKSTEKLIGSLAPKVGYWIHYRYLKTAVRLGMKVTAFNQCISFNQSPFLADYINFNTDMRAQATSEFEKDQCKLMNNSVFGKMMEDVRRRMLFELVVDVKTAEKRIAKPNYKYAVKFSSDIYGIHFEKTKVVLDRPIYVGQCILDESKRIMAEFYYGVLKQRYGEKVKLAYSDTDSVITLIETDDFYADIKDMADHYDLSNFPKSFFLHDETNKKVVGKMKDELAEVKPENWKSGDPTYVAPIKSFCALRSKMYSFHAEFLTEKKDKSGKVVKRSWLSHDDARAKGVGRVAQKKLKHSDYLSCLMDQTEQMVSFKSIRSVQHVIKTETIEKTGLSCYDDKRFILSNGFDTLAFGHWRIKNL